MSAEVTILLTAGMVATATGLLGPFLVLRRVSLMGDAVSHAVLPGIIVVYLLLDTRSPILITVGAAAFAVICVLIVDGLRATGLVKSDAAIALTFPMLFSIGVIGITSFASGVHLDLDAVLYGEIAFAPFLTWEVLGLEVGQAMTVLAVASLLNLGLVAGLWKEFKATTFDPGYSEVAGMRPTLLGRAVLIATAITAVAAFESVGAILVVAMLIVPAATAHLLTDRLWLMVVTAVGVGWLSALLGFEAASALDASIAGAMGVVAVLCFTVALLAAPRYGLVARALTRRVNRRRVGGALADRRPVGEALTDR